MKGEEVKRKNGRARCNCQDDIDENEEKINHHGKRADAIVKGMLQHSRTSSGQKEPTDINALAMNICASPIMAFVQKTNHLMQN